MVQLLKIKEHIYRFIGKYEIYTIAVFRFLVAICSIYTDQSENRLYGFAEGISDSTVICITVFLFAFRNDAVFRSSSDPAELLRIIIGIVRDRGIDFCDSFLHLFPFFQKKKECMRC